MEYLKKLFNAFVIALCAYGLLMIVATSIMYYSSYGTRQEYIKVKNQCENVDSTTDEQTEMYCQGYYKTRTEISNEIITGLPRELIVGFICIFAISISLDILLEIFIPNKNVSNVINCILSAFLVAIPVIIWEMNAFIFVVFLLFIYAIIKIILRKNLTLKKQLIFFGILNLIVPFLLFNIEIYPDNIFSSYGYNVSYYGYLIICILINAAIYFGFYFYDKYNKPKKKVKRKKYLNI